MAGRIPESFIAQLLDRIDIVDVVDARVKLKRAGHEFKACCPFHQEKSPSFTVSPKKQFYHCFGCGAHGTAIGFLMEYENLDFPDAIEELAQQAGLDVPREARSAMAPSVDQNIYGVLKAAERFFRRQLAAHPPAHQYLKNRGISGETARDFGLGYAPEQWDALAKHLNESGFSQDVQIKAGLLVRKDAGGVYDKFRNRLMFPIYDRRGRTIAFGGRLMGDSKGPKYLNSPETPVFHKGKELYNYLKARDAAKQPDNMLVVEGYMDVIGLAQAGIKNAVATLGTATTEDHAERLFRTVPQVICCFDGDRAGRQAAWRAVETFLPRMQEGRELRFLFLPEGEDPDSLVRRENGVERFTSMLNKATPLSEVFFAHFSKQIDTHSVDGRSRFIAETRPLLAKIPEGSFRDLMFEKLQAISQTHKRLDRPAQPASKNPSRRTALEIKRTPMRTAITALLMEPDLAQTPDLANNLASLRGTGSELLKKLVEFNQDRPNLSTATILELWPHQSDKAVLSKLAGGNLLAEDANLAHEFDEAIAALKRERNRNRIAALRHKQQETGLDSAEKVELMALLRASAGAGDNGQ